jgi:SET domain-containing protein
MEVRKSSIAGKGLFTTINRKKDEFICFYDGDVLSYSQFVRKYNSRIPKYVFQVNNDLYIDAEHPRYINRYINSALHTDFLANCATRVSKKYKTISIYAKKDIPAGTELLMSYGKSYRL